MKINFGIEELNSYLQIWTGLGIWPNQAVCVVYVNIWLPKKEGFTCLSWQFSVKNSDLVIYEKWAKSQIQSCQFRIDWWKNHVGQRSRASSSQHLDPSTSAVAAAVERREKAAKRELVVFLNQVAGPQRRSWLAGRGWQQTILFNRSIGPGIRLGGETHKFSEKSVEGFVQIIFYWID